jgi:hypothetical protein
VLSLAGAEHRAKNIAPKRSGTQKAADDLKQSLCRGLVAGSFAIEIAQLPKVRAAKARKRSTKRFQK